MKALIDVEMKGISVRKQCALLGLNRSSFYRRSEKNKERQNLLLREIDQMYTAHPYYGSRRIVANLSEKGYRVNRKCIQRLFKILGIEAIYPKKRTTIVNTTHKKYSYLLRGYSVTQPNQVWSTDITYVRMDQGFLYLVVVLDWYSRYVLSWELSNSLDTHFCIRALEKAFEKGTPTIFNSDQGCQFTSQEFISRLENKGIQISMDGRGRALDNIFVERFWRSIKYEEIYLKNYIDGVDAYKNLEKYLLFYNQERLHQSLGYKAPERIWKGDFIANAIEIQ